MLRRLIMVAPLLILATACSSAPAEFEDRAQLPACPTEEIGQEGGLSDASVDCLNQGSQKSPGAELKVVRNTSEGDPVEYYYRVQFGQPGFVVYIDSSADSYGDGGWTKVTCADGADYSRIDQCSESEAL